MKRTCLSLLLPLLAVSVSAFGAVDPGLLALVPAGTVLLGGVDATAARSSDFGQYLLRRMDTEDQNFQQFVQDTGFDPRRDLQTFMFAGFGPRQTHDHSKFAILARGNFDTDRIEAAAKAKGATVRSYRGLHLYVSENHVSENHGDQTAFAFPDTGVAVMGDLATVREIVDHRSNPTILDPGLLERVTRAALGNDMWFASLMSGAFLGNHMDLPSGEQLKNSQALESILQSSGGMHFGETVKMTFDATTRSAKDAESLRDVIRFFTSMVQTQRQNGARASILASALDGMELRIAASDIHVSVSLSEKNLEQLAQAGASHGR